MTDTPPDRPYPPPYFVERRPEILAEFIRANPFGYLVTAGAKGLRATAVPFVLSERGGSLVLQAHLAANNPQAHAPAGEALAIFHGPHAYVRPAWYQGAGPGARSVPTWDYISVQARGPMRLTGSGLGLMPHLADLAAQSEAPFEDPWSPADAAPDYALALSQRIVGVEIGPISLEGVWKLHQNHGEANRRGVIEGLTATGEPDGLAIAAAIAELEA
jgi:transcriptional regulator